MTNGFSVLIIDNAHYMEPETERTVDGFTTLDEAIAFAKNRVRDSVEELRSPGISKADLRKLWLIYGENALVIGGNYSGADEVDYFIEHPMNRGDREMRAPRAYLLLPTIARI